MNSKNNISIKDVLDLQEKSYHLYKEVVLKNLFEKFPKKAKGLTFGYICPGAIKTIKYLNQNEKLIDKKILDEIIKLTDFQFFIEIFVIYKDYLDDELLLKIKKIIKNKSCDISKVITKRITYLFGKLPKNIKDNLPDNFYHIRHNTLICSKNIELANERIELLKSIYGTSEGFNNTQYVKCLNARDGVSGCRTCCKKNYSKNYSMCVSKCMDF